MAGIFGKLAGFVSQISNARVPAKPYSEQGVAGYGVYGGYLSSPEKNPALNGPNRWVTAADLLSNVSIIAASVRYTLNLISRPRWKADPVSDKAEAKQYAEFVEEVINGIDTSWSRIIRRSAVYRFHGFNLQEWVAVKRDDGKIGIASLDQRPAHTITKWDCDENGGILGVIQVSPQTGQEIYLPRSKLVYLVDDALTDRPDGLGWFRQLAEPAQRLRRYLKLETMGYERDLAGIPIGRAPLQRIEQLVLDGKLQRKDADSMIAALRNFVSMQAKEPSTGLLLDSEPFRAKTESGETISSVMQWGMELLTGSPSTVAALGESIHRIMMDMALVMGTDSILVGSRGQGSRALSEDKSRNLYLTAQSTLNDMAEAYDRDIVTPLWTMNGFPDEMRPRLTTEDVAFKDAATIAKALADLATAGAILDPNDPAINDLRSIMGVSDAPPVDAATAELMLGAKAGITQPGADPNDPNAPGGGGGAPSQPGRPSRENPSGSGSDQQTKEPKAKAKKDYDPAEPRDDHGRWTDAAGPRSFPNPLNDNERLFSDPTGQKVGGVTVRDKADGWHVSDMRSITRGGGRAAMQHVTDLADENGKRLSLFAVPLDSPAGKKMSKANLIKWYEGFGFKVEGGRVGGDYMVREPVNRGTKVSPEAWNTLSRIAGEERNSHGNLMGAKRFEKYDPNEPRDYHGRWTGGGSSIPLTKELKSVLTSKNIGKDVHQMRADAIENQKALDGIGAQLEQQGLADYEPPPAGYEVKTADSATRKIMNEGYAGAHEITDYSRASFVIDHPEEAGGVIDALRQRGEVYDKGWQRLKTTGYLDRKVYLQHPNGGLSEIQITPRGVFQVKMGQGHRLYEVARLPSTPREVASSAMRKSRTLYGKVVSHTPFAAIGRLP